MCFNMNSKQKYIAFLENLIDVTGQKKLIESVIKAHDIIFEADVIPSSRYGADPAGRGAWKGMVNDRFPGAIEGEKTSKPTRMQQEVERRASKFMDTVEGGPEFVNDVKEMFAELVDDGEINQDTADAIIGALENADPDSAKVRGTTGLEGLEKMFDTLISQNKFDNILKYLNSIAGDTGMGRLSQRAEQYYGFGTVDGGDGSTADEQDELFMRGLNMGELLKKSGTAKIGAERNGVIPDSIKNAAIKSGMSKQDLKALSANYVSITKALNKTQHSFVQYIWGIIKTNSSKINQDITAQLAQARNIAMKNAMKQTNNPDKINRLMMEAVPAWPYSKGTGAHQTMFKRMSAGGDEASNKALAAIGMTPSDVVSNIMKSSGLSPETASKHLSNFLSQYKQKNLGGLDNDNPNVIAVNAIAEDNTKSNELYSGIINALNNDA